MDFQPGDVVRLKSGGPKMTAETVDETGVSCTWFVGDKVEGRIFQKHMLEKVAPSISSTSATNRPR
jgi:uncharacterized protein YodC (DUF2158 family)